MQTIEISLRNALFTLNRIEVRGEYAKAYSQVMDAINMAIKAIDQTKKEAEAHENHNEQEKNV